MSGLAKTITGLTLGALFAGLIAVAAVRFWNTLGTDTVKEYYLGDTDWSGYVGAVVQYNREPVSVILVSPDGQTYGMEEKKGMFSIFSSGRKPDIYEVDKEKRTITILVDTSSTGGWHVRFAPLSNTQIKYKLVEKVSPTLYMHGGKEIIQEGGKSWIEFTASALSTKLNNGKFRYTLMLEGSQYSKIIAEGEGNLNEKTKIEITPPRDKYDGNTYGLKLSASTVVMGKQFGDESPEPETKTVSSSLSILLKPKKGDQAAP